MLLFGVFSFMQSHLYGKRWDVRIWRHLLHAISSIWKVLRCSYLASSASCNLICMENVEMLVFGVFSFMQSHLYGKRWDIRIWRDLLHAISSTWKTLRCWYLVSLASCNLIYMENVEIFVSGVICFMQSHLYGKRWDVRIWRHLLHAISSTWKTLRCWYLVSLASCNLIYMENVEIFVSGVICFMQSHLYGKRWDVRIWRHLLHAISSIWKVLRCSYLASSASYNLIYMENVEMLVFGVFSFMQSHLYGKRWDVRIWRHLLHAISSTWKTLRCSCLESLASCNVI